MMTLTSPQSRPLVSSLHYQLNIPKPLCHSLFKWTRPLITSRQTASKLNLTAIYILASLLAAIFHLAQSQATTSNSSTNCVNSNGNYSHTCSSVGSNLTNLTSSESLAETNHSDTLIVLPQPFNISVILIQWNPPAVRVHWDYSRSELRNCRLKTFQIVYHPVKSRYRIIQEVPPFYKNLTLDRLQRGTEYTLQINAVSETDQTNVSRVVQFISPDNETRRSHRKFINRPIHTYPDEITEGLQVREDEVVIVVLVIMAWIGCIFIFFNKWGKIRMLEPYQPQYKESFHNSVHSIHPKPSRMNTCTSVPPNMISIESRGSLIGERELLLHQHRLTESGQLYQCASGSAYHHPAYRSRLNSVFVGNPYHRNSLFIEPNMPRKVKSAEDLKSLVVQVNNNIPSTSTSVL